jgi:hypothetical protein
MPVDVGESHTGRFCREAVAQARGWNGSKAHEYLENDLVIGSCPAVSSQVVQGMGGKGCESAVNQMPQNEALAFDLVRAS